MNHNKDIKYYLEIINQIEKTRKKIIKIGWIF